MQGVSCVLHSAFVPRQLVWDCYLCPRTLLLTSALLSLLCPSVCFCPPLPHLLRLSKSKAVQVHFAKSAHLIGLSALVDAG